jgi:hypothetical protein
VASQRWRFFSFKTKKLVLSLQVSMTRRTVSKLAMEILQESKHLSRQLHEFKLACMDLRGAEGRRKMSDVHLEKARNGALGIDYSEETVEISKA